MTKLPVCSGGDAIRILKKAGWIQDRQRGSHVTPCRAASLAVTLLMVILPAALSYVGTPPVVVRHGHSGRHKGRSLHSLTE